MYVCVCVRETERDRKRERREKNNHCFFYLQTEKARHILQVRQKKLDMLRLRQVVKMPSDKELSKKSDEHKALLAQKCVDLLMKKTGSQEEISEVSMCIFIIL